MLIYQSAVRRVLTALRTETIADKVYDRLREDIATGLFRPGARIHEKTIAVELGISRTPIREALIRLEGEGVVVCSSRRSYNVRTLSVADVREIYDTLGILEGAVARIVVPRLTAEDVQALRRFNRTMEDAAARADLPAFGHWNRQFHDVFLTRLDNHTLRTTCHIVRGPLYTFPVNRRSLAKWLRKSIVEHRAIIRLVQDGDAGAAGDYFRDVHWSYDRNRRFITDAFDREGEAAVHL
jgi:DNA-binding GntR family transcriptional regulator